MSRTHMGPNVYVVLTWALQGTFIIEHSMLHDTLHDVAYGHLHVPTCNCQFVLLFGRSWAWAEHIWGQMYVWC